MAPKRKKGPHLPYRQVGVGAEHGVGANGHRSTCYDLRVEDTLRARVRLARWRRVRALRLLRARARLSRLRLARVRAERKIDQGHLHAAKMGIDAIRARLLEGRVEAAKVRYALGLPMTATRDEVLTAIHQRSA